MGWVKVFHFVFVFIWVGSLMTLTRMMMKHNSYTEEVKEVMVNLYSRFYNFAQLPSMIIAVTLGMILIGQLDQSKNLGWFHMKLTLAMSMIFCDILCHRFIQRMREGSGNPRMAHVLHGVSGLLVVGIAVSLYVLR